MWYVCQNIEATRLQLDHYNSFCYIDWVLKAVKYVLGPFKRKDYFQKLQMTSLARVVYGFVRWTIKMLKLAQYLSQWYLPLCKCHICSSQCALLQTLLDHSERWFHSQLQPGNSALLPHRTVWGPHQPVYKGYYRTFRCLPCFYLWDLYIHREGLCNDQMV